MITDAKTGKGRPAHDVQKGDYDRHAENFFSKAEALLSWVHGGKPALKSLLLRAIGDRDPKEIKVVDLGSASARVENFMHEELGIGLENMTGIEYSPDQVEIARKRFPEADFRQGDIRVVELPEEEYDIALSHMVFEHLSNEGLLATFRNTLVALKRGGELDIVVTSPEKIVKGDGENFEPVTVEAESDGEILDHEGMMQEVKKGEEVTVDHSFETTAPWGGTVTNWYRSKEAFVRLLELAGYIDIEVEDVYIEEEGKEYDPETYDKYQKKYDGLLRLSIRARKAA